jgi:hypothetical protein
VAGDGARSRLEERRDSIAGPSVGRRGARVLALVLASKEALPRPRQRRINVEGGNWCGASMEFVAGLVARLALRRAPGIFA